MPSLFWILLLISAVVTTLYVIRDPDHGSRRKGVFTTQRHPSRETSYQYRSWQRRQDTFGPIPFTERTQKSFPASPAVSSAFSSKASRGDEENAEEAEEAAEIIYDEKSVREIAESVESTANRRLANMTEQLDLSEAQQDAIFPLIARSLPQWNPKFQVHMSRGDSPTLPAMAVPAEAANQATASTSAGSTAKAPAKATAMDKDSSAALSTDAESTDTEPTMRPRLTREELIAEITKRLSSGQNQQFLRNALIERAWWNEVMARIRSGVNAKDKQVTATEARESKETKAGKSGRRPNVFPNPETQEPKKSRVPLRSQARNGTQFKQD